MKNHVIQVDYMNVVIYQEISHIIKTCSRLATNL